MLKVVRTLRAKFNSIAAVIFAAGAASFFSAGQAFASCGATNCTWGPPGGQSTLLMSHAGNGSVSKITLTFDDAATNSLPSGAVLTTGTNKPTAYSTTTIFP